MAVMLPNSTEDLLGGTILRSSFRSTHRILEIDYSENKLTCLCGWVCRAYDDPSKKDEYDWQTHRKEAPPIEKSLEDQYRGRYQRIKKAKGRVAV